ncbi:hypothetical protein G6O67_006482 [Ophiocordyceps sinensis]|uniref:DUF2423 domain-containing protein n=2 Tax=Ophiocordyceps sinensis TaxID=72228 RepID=A0A8H4PKP7_9HYPO|nr:putative protein family UPF0642 [Ophiocordyceps sinensis CO18]KAF4506392.1 hypothetical protein G6O67_006482 [Ophiocordyceps sinensis]
MAKSSRSSAKKLNNRRKVAAVFGPAELARNERLSAKLLDLAKQPKPEASREVAMEINDDDANEAEANVEDTVMEVDSKEPSTKGKKRVEKRKQKKSSVVFKRYSDRLATKKRNKTKGPQ